MDEAQRVLIGVMMRPLTFGMGATLQFLSGGRFMLGIGAGWNEEE